MSTMKTAGAILALAVMLTSCGDGPAPATRLAADTQDAGREQAGARGESDTAQWETVSTMPLPIRYPWVHVSTGQRLLFWGGVTHAPDEKGYDFSLGYPPGYPGYLGTAAVDGIAYEPEADRWEPIPPAPIPALAREATSVWTGRELLVWGPVPGTRSSAGALYDPHTRQWRQMVAQDRLILGQGTWAGDRFVVLGWDRERRVIAAAYLPDTDQWTGLPDPPVRNYHGLLAWTGTEVIATDGYDIHDIVRWAPADKQWRPTAPGPDVKRVAHSSLAISGRFVFMFGRSLQTEPPTDMLMPEPGMAVYDMEADEWWEAAEPPGGNDLRGAYSMWVDRMIYRPVPGGSEAYAYEPDGDRWKPAPVPPHRDRPLVAHDAVWSLTVPSPPDPGQPYVPATLERYDLE
jgi:hypothetical protein